MSGLHVARRLRLIVFASKLFNPLVLAIAGRRWMPVLGVLHHRGLADRPGLRHQ